MKGGERAKAIFVHVLASNESDIYIKTSLTIPVLSDLSLYRWFHGV